MHHDGTQEPDSSILFHDGGAQQLFIAMGSDGSHAQPVADWSHYFAPVTAASPSFKAHYDKRRRTAVVAGTLLPGVAADGGIIGVQLVNVSAFENFFVTSTTLSLATIPRTAYNVWEGGTKRVSMDVGGMEPRAVLHEACPPTFRALQMCYAVYMERPAHMEFMRAYIPENGGMDIEFYSYTASLMDNALGHPLTRYGGASNTLVYTLRGACFQIESRMLTEVRFGIYYYYYYYYYA